MRIHITEELEVYIENLPSGYHVTIFDGDERVWAGRAQVLHVSTGGEKTTTRMKGQPGE